MTRVTVAGLTLELSDAQAAELREQLGVDQVASAPQALDVKGMATRLGRSVDFVYDHARELGGEKIGGVWVFDRASAAAQPATEGPGRPAESPPRARRQRGRQRGASLAIRGSKPL